MEYNIHKKIKSIKTIINKEKIKTITDESVYSDQPPITGGDTFQTKIQLEQQEQKALNN